MPLINYGCTIWTINVTCNFKRVQTQKNKAVRLIGKYGTRILSTESIFSKLRILSVGQIRDFQLSIFCVSQFEWFSRMMFPIIFLF